MHPLDSHPLQAAAAHQYCAPSHCSACRAPSRSAASVGSSLCVAMWRMSTSSRDRPADSARPDTEAATLPFCSESVMPLTSLGVWVGVSRARVSRGRGCLRIPWVRSTSTGGWRQWCFFGGGRHGVC